MPDPIETSDMEDVKDRMAFVVSVAQVAFNPGLEDGEPAAMGVAVFAFPVPYEDGEHRVLYGASAPLESVIEAVEGFAKMARKELAAAPLRSRPDA